MSAAQSACPSASAADSAPKSRPEPADQNPAINQTHLTHQRARAWYFAFRVPINATIAEFSEHDEWSSFWKTGLDSQYRIKNLTNVDIISISSQKTPSNSGSIRRSNDESNHAMNESCIFDAGSYLSCDGFIHAKYHLRYAAVLKWLSPEQTCLDISDLLLTPISDTSGRRTNYCDHPLIHTFLSETSPPQSLPGVPADPAAASYSLASPQTPPPQAQKLTRCAHKCFILYCSPFHLQMH